MPTVVYRFTGVSESDMESVYERVHRPRTVDNPRPVIAILDFYGGTLRVSAASSQDLEPAIEYLESLPRRPLQRMPPRTNQWSSFIRASRYQDRR